MATVVPIAYQANTSLAVPDWLNKGDNAWQMIAATIVGMQSMPGLVILYGSIVKKKWAVNSAFMALYAFAAVLICWVTWAYKMSFGEKLLPFWGKAGPALGQKFLVRQAEIPATEHKYDNGTVETAAIEPYFPMATTVYFQFVFAAITLILLAGSLLGRMNIKAWMAFVPLWLTFSYTVGAFSVWGGGFLFQWGVIDYSGGYVIHLSSGIAGFTAAYWVGPRLSKDRERFPPNNVLLMLAGAGLLWMGWSGFNGGGAYAANIDSSMAVLNTNICAATSLLIWTCLDVIFFKKPSVIGAVQGMITGLVCITPGAVGFIENFLATRPNFSLPLLLKFSLHIPLYTSRLLLQGYSLFKSYGHKFSAHEVVLVFLTGVCLNALYHLGVVQGWAAIAMGVLSGSIPWFTMMIVHKRSALLQKVDDTLAVFHTHAVAGLLGGALTGLFAEPALCSLFLPVTNSKGAFYGSPGGMQFFKQLVGASFIIGWNLVVTTLILLVIGIFIPLRMPDEELLIGDDAVHGEEAYALWADGEKYDSTKHGWYSDDTQHPKGDANGQGARGVTIEL
eukprot:Gb_33684 [translate_table: standard]